MSANKYKEHIYLIPEDDKDRQLAVGFLGCEAVASRVVIPLPPAGGWPKVLSLFEGVYIPILRNNQMAHVVMVIDFDENVDE